MILRVMTAVLLVPLVLNSSAGLAGSPPAEKAPPLINEKATLMLEVWETPENGESSKYAEGGNALGVGDSGSTGVGFGWFDRNGRPVEDIGGVGIGEPRAFGTSPDEWVLRTRLQEATVREMVFELEWTRFHSDQIGKPKQVGQLKRTVTLRPGQIHHLDFWAGAAAGNGGKGSVLFQVRAGIQEDPALVSKRLRYKIWLADEVPAKPAQKVFFELTGKQGEELPLSLAPLRWAAPGIDLGGRAMEVLGIFSGAITGRIRPGGEIALQFNLNRNLGLVPAGFPRLIGFCGNGGEKFAQVKRGESVKLILPAPGGGHSLRADHLQSLLSAEAGFATGTASAWQAANAPLLPGLWTKDGQASGVEFAKFFAGHNMSLIVQVDVVDEPAPDRAANR